MRSRRSKLMGMKQQHPGRRFACLLAILAVSAGLAPVAAQATPAVPQTLPSLSGLLPASTYAELMKSGSIVQTAPEGKGPVLLPTHASAASIKAALASEKPNLIMEALYLYRRPRPSDPQAELRALYAEALTLPLAPEDQAWVEALGRAAAC